MSPVMALGRFWGATSLIYNYEFSYELYELYAFKERQSVCILVTSVVDQVAVYQAEHSVNPNNGRSYLQHLVRHLFASVKNREDTANPRQG